MTSRFLFYLATLFLIGLGYLAILPAFEGFDEAGHFSSIRQVADTGTIPLYGQSFLDKAYMDYRGPRSYASTFPYDVGMVYSKFFKNSGLIADYKRDYREARGFPLFTPSEEGNWEAQHPPFYYVLMAPLSLFSLSEPFVTQFFILRFFSYMLTLGGIALGLLALKGYSKETEQQRLGFYLYPLVMPAFFSEFLRIGNDSLCIFLIGILTWLLSRWRQKEYSLLDSFAIGLAFGIGLLTKGFFLILLLALGSFFVLRLWRDKSNRMDLRKWGSLALMGCTALAIGGYWSLYKAINFGNATGSHDAIVVMQHGGLLRGLEEHFSIVSFVSGVASLFIDFLWMGTRSHAYLPPVLHAPLLGLLGLIVFQYGKLLKKKKIIDFDFLPVWLFTFLIIGMLSFLLYTIAEDGVGHVPGWYPHILMPLIAPMVGVTISSLLKNENFRFPVILCLYYAVIFQMMAIWAQIALVTGCASKNLDREYIFPDADFCLFQISLIGQHLSVIGWPSLAIGGFGGGLLCAIYLAKKVRATPIL